MSGIPISHRGRHCWHCECNANGELVEGDRFAIGSIRPWLGPRRTVWRRPTKSDRFICQDCLSQAALVLAGAPAPVLDDLLRRARRGQA